MQQTNIPLSFSTARPAGLMHVRSAGRRVPTAAVHRSERPLIGSSTGLRARPPHGRIPAHLSAAIVDPSLSNMSNVIQ